MPEKSMPFRSEQTPVRQTEEEEASIRLGGPRSNDKEENDIQSEPDNRAAELRVGDQ